LKITSEWLSKVAAQATDDDDDGPCIAGGFRASRDRTLDQLAKACKARDIAEVQRLALMTLTWWSGKQSVLHLGPSYQRGDETIEDDRKLYEKLKARTEAKAAEMDERFHVGNVVRHKTSGGICKVARFAHDGTTDFWADNETGPYKQSDFEKIAER
jgi:hypothetical protein